MLILGFLLIQIGLTGKLGSILGAIIDPASMQEGTGSTGTGATAAPADTAAGTLAVTSLMISSVFGPYASQAIKIVDCESNFNTNAVDTTSVNGSNATGLFQILYPSTWSSTSYASGNPKDAMTNIKAAYEIFKRDGYSWKEWACASKVGL
jgi:hypothetical protein